MALQAPAAVRESLDAATNSAHATVGKDLLDPQSQVVADLALTRAVPDRFPGSHMRQRERLLLSIRHAKACERHGEAERMGRESSPSLDLDPIHVVDAPQSD